MREKNIEYLLSEPAQKKTDKLIELLDVVNRSEISSIQKSVIAIVRVIRDPRTTVRELKEVIQIDPPLAARVLKTANSAYYSRTFSKVFTDIEQAIIWMGTDTVKDLALSQKVCEIFNKEEVIENYSRKALWIHSVAVALMAKNIYRREFGLKGENAYVAGLLHDIGIIAEDQFLQDEFRNVLRLSKAKNYNMAKSEQEIFGFDHDAVGAGIAESWGLPEELIAAVGFHNHPIESESEFARITNTMYVADFYCQQNGFTYGAAPESDSKILDKCISSLDVKPYALELIINLVRDEIKIMVERGLL